MPLSNFIIIGSGRRVQQDILPVLSFIGIAIDKIQIYAKREKHIFVRDVNYEVKNLNKLQFIENDSIVYIAITSNAVESVTEFILSINNNIRIIIDTPINKKSLIRKFENNKISVAEDAHFLAKYLLKRNLKINKFNIIIFYKSAMSYHAIAFIESILSKIIFHITFFHFYLAISCKGISIILGKKDYETGKIWLNFSRITIPELTKNEEKLIGGRSDYDTISYRFLDLKRLGLVMLINNCIDKKDDKISLKNAYSHFLKSNLIGDFQNYCIKIFKKIFKFRF